MWGLEAMSTVLDGIDMRAFAGGGVVAGRWRGHFAGSDGHARRRASLRVLALTVSATVTSSLLAVPPAVAAPPKPPSPSGVSVPVKPVKPKAPVSSASEQSAPRAGKPVWPSAGSAVADVSAGPVKPGGLPVRVKAAPRPVGVQAVTASGTPAQVGVSVADATVASQAGVTGVVFSLARADGQAGAAQAGVEVDYSGFASAFGADFGQRLQLVAMPACVLSTPQVRACQAQTPVRGSRNDELSRSVVAESVTVAGVQSPASVFAVTASSTSAGATWNATSLSHTYAWSAGTQGGDFGYSYPLEVPPSFQGPKPELALQYSSGMVDGQTWAANGQSSWIGEGWDLQVGYIERSYRGCADDGASTGDLCWFSPYNATIVFEGKSTPLVRDNATGVWHAQDDDGWRIELVTDTSLGNGDNDGEYWKVTTRDGTQYFFGKHRRYAGDNAVTNSVQTEPVFGNNPGEPCNNGAGFAASWCQQAYRWNLDYVVDPQGNSMTYVWNKFQGKYGINNNASAQPYDLSATLDHIDYGTRAGSEASASAPMQVSFKTVGRCLHDCVRDDYPDTPWDRYCELSASSCPGKTSPAFFLQHRLANVTTKVWDPAKNGYRTVDAWDLSHTFPASGDNIPPAGNDTNPNLWLDTITHTGTAADGSTLAEPPVRFGGTLMANRVDWGNGIGVAPYSHYRLTSINTGTGGQTTVGYSPVECANGAPKQNSDANPYRCFPQYSKPIIAPAGWVWFNKYVVTQVTDTDLTGGSPDEVTSYAYSTAGSTDTSLWYHDANESSPIAQTSWSQWRGYTTVTVTHGAAGGPQTVTRTLYHRGMAGDAKKSGDDTQVLFGTRRAALTSPLAPKSGVPTGIAGAGSLCLDIVGGSTGNGSWVGAYPCNNQWNQVWQRQPDNTLKNPQSGRCLDISGAATNNGAWIHLWDCVPGAPNEVWMRQPDGSLRNPASGRCLDITGYATAAGSGGLQLYDCTGMYNQVWQPTNTGALSNPQAGRCIDVHNGGTTNGTSAESFICHGGTSQVWQPQTDGTVRNPISGRCLNIVSGGTAAGTPVQLWDCNPASAEEIFTVQDDGTLRNPASGRCLDSGANPGPGSPLTIGDCTDAFSQQWTGRVVDADGLQGFTREHTALDGGAVAQSEIHLPTVTQTAVRSAPATGGQDFRAYLVNETSTKTRTWLAASNTWRWTSTDTGYDGYGLPVDVNDYGDVTAAGDDTCTHTDYARDTTRWMIDYPSRKTTTTYAANPSGDDYLNGTQTFYDGSTVNGAAPTKGLATKVDDLAAVNGGTITWKQASRFDYDNYGREIAEYDELDRKTGTAYTPAEGAAVTLKTETNPVGWTSTTALDPGTGSVTATTDVNGKKTIAAYDPLDRLTKVWANNRPTTATPDIQYTYTLSGNTPNSIETKKLGPNGKQITSYGIFDGRLRPRQTQRPTSSATGGRMVDDIAYDGRGLKATTSTFFNNATAPSSTLVTFADTDVPTQDRYSYDNLERQVTDAFYSSGTNKWQTTTVPQGDREAVIPPAGGITTQKLFNADGKVTEQRQYAGTDLAGAFQKTTYSYDREEQLTKVVDPAGNTWTWTYDPRGRKLTETDPDSGTTTNTYDDADKLLTTTDARPVTLAYEYDTLGRKTKEHKDSPTGPLLASWTYDTLAKGKLTFSSRYEGSNAYTEAVTGYDDANRPLGTTVTLPASEGTALARDWTTTVTYNADGSPATKTYPAASGLDAETVTYTYDDNGFAQTAKGADTYVAATTYQPWGEVFQRTLGTDGKRVRITTEDWADTHRTKGISAATEKPGAAGTFDDKLAQQYNWTDAGLLASVDTRQAAATTDSQCFTYDGYQQLTTAFTIAADKGTCTTTPTAATVSGPDAYWHTYTYDPAGNRTSLLVHGVNGAADSTSTYSYPNAGTPKAHTLSGVTTTGAAGNHNRSYTYNGVGALTGMTIDGQRTDVTYTPFDRIATTTQHTADGNKTTTYRYNADNDEILRATPTGKTLYLDDHEIQTDASGNATTDATRYYTAAGTTIASRRNSGPLSWLAYDDQNTSQLAINADTLAVSIRKQDPFGNARGTNPAWPNSRGFVGGTKEPTGLIHLGARMYDPTTGRFTSDDPVTDTDNPQQLNGYTYAYNNPTTYTDPDGNWGFSFKGIMNAVATVASVASIIPGPIGAIAAGVATVAYVATGQWGQAATMAAGIALAAVGAGAAVLAVKAAKVVNQVRAVASGAKTITNVGRTARGAINAGKVVSNTLGKAGRSVKAAGSAAKKWIANGNNFVRVGRVNAKSPFRVSIGPHFKHWQRMGVIGRALNPIHLHVEKAYGGVRLNWFAKTIGSKKVPRSWTWWRR